MSAARPAASQSEEEMARDVHGLRVLHIVATGERRGAEVFASDLVRALGRMGMQQCVVVVRGTPPFPIRYPEPVVPLDARREGIPGIHVDLRAARRLRRFVEEWHPTIVQTHGGETMKYGVMAVGRKTPIVARWIGMAPSWVTSGPRRFAYSQIARRISRIAAIAESVDRQLTSTFKVPQDRVVTIPNGVDADRMTPSTGRRTMRSELGIAQDAEVLLSICALTWEKDPLAHVEVARRLHTDRPNLVHLIAGDGPMRRETEEAIHDFGLVGRTFLLGNRPDMADLLAASDAVLFASRNDGMEGMPTIAIEAGMVGVPLVGYAVAGLSEVVVHAATGLLVRPGDVDALVAAARRLLGDAGLRRRLGAAARDRCRARFAIDLIATQHVDLYMEILNVVPARTASS